MLRKYELTVIYNQDDKIRAEGVSFVEGVLASKNVKIITKTEIGPRLLAYEINKMSRAFYIYYEIEAQESAIALITREFNLSHLILRYLFVQVDQETEGQVKKRERKEEKMRAFLARKAEFANSKKEKTPDKDKEAEIEALAEANAEAVRESGESNE